MINLTKYRWLIGNLSLRTVISNEIRSFLAKVLKSDRMKQENSLIYKIIVAFC